MIKFDGRSYVPYHITIPKIDVIDKVNLTIRDCTDELYFYTKGKLISSQIKMKTMFEKKMKKGDIIQIYIRL